MSSALRSICTAYTTCQRLCGFITPLLLLIVVSSTANAQVTFSTRADSSSMPSGGASGAIVGTYPLSGFENVNLYNGKLNFALPLVSVGGRGAAGYTLKLGIDKQWYVEHERTGPYGCTYGAFNGCHYDDHYTARDNGNSPDPYWRAGAMWGMHTGRDNLACGSFPQGLDQQVTRLFFRAQDGSVHELRDTIHHGKWLEAGSCYGGAGYSRGQEFVAVDGSGMRFLSDAVITDEFYHGRVFSLSGMLTMRDGTRYRFNNTGGDSKLQWMEDRHGNRVTFTYDPTDPTSGYLTEVTDTRGRKITFTGPEYRTTSINFTGFGGTARAISFRYDEPWLRPDYPAAEGQKTIQQLFPELIDSLPTERPALAGPTSVTLPDNRSYRFYYNPYGELARVELPTGGAYEYDWAKIAVGNLALYRRVTERRVYADKNSQTPVHIQTFREHIVNYRPVGVVTVESLDPANRTVVLERSVHYFHGNAYDSLIPDTDPLKSSAGSVEGREYRTEVFDPATNALLRRVEHTWQPHVTRQWGPYTYSAENPLLKQTITTLADTGQSAKTTYEHDNDLNVPRTKYYPYVSASTNPPPPQDDCQLDPAGCEPDPDPPMPSTLPLRTEEAVFLVNDPNVAPATRDAYRARNLVGLPTATRVYAGEPTPGTHIAETLLGYDETALVDRGAVTCNQTMPCWSNPGTTARANVTTIRQWLNKPTSTYLTTRAEYDTLGNAVKSIDARGGVSQVEYSATHFYSYPTRTISAVPDPSGVYGSSAALTTSTAYDFSTGLVTSATDAMGRATTFNYTDPATGQPDKLERLRKVARPDGGATSYFFNDVAGDLYVETVTKRTTNAADDLKARQYFDNLGRTTRGFSFEGGSTWSVADTLYDRLGRVAQTSNPYRGSLGAQVPAAGQEWTVPTYDALGRVSTIRTPDNAVVTTTYSGTTVTVTDQAGKQRRSETDALGRLVAVTEAPNATCQPNGDGSGCTTRYLYDVLGNLHEVQQGDQRRYFMYDSLSRLIRAKNPEQAVNTNLPPLSDPVTSNSQWSLAYEYDANGNLKKRTDARNITTDYNYDALNRNTTIRYAGDPSSSGINNYYDYYRYWQKTRTGGYWRNINALGYWVGDKTLSTQGATVNETQARDFDVMGRPTSHIGGFYTGTGSSTYNGVGYVYDLAGNITTVYMPSNEQNIYYSYTPAGRLAKVEGYYGGAYRTYSGGIQYDAAGRMTHEQFGTQTPVYHRRKFNVRGQLYDVRLSTSSTDAENWNRGALTTHYSRIDGWAATGRDNNGNALRTHHWVPNNDAVSSYALTYDDYLYDNLNRLMSVSERNAAGAVQLTQSYSYDRWGNRTINQAGTTQTAGINRLVFEVEATTNRLYAQGDAGRAAAQKWMRYDAGGHLTWDQYTGNGTRVYDAEGRIVQATDSSGNTARYEYNGRGQRVRRVTGGVEWRMVYGVSGELIAEFMASSPLTPSQEYVYRGGQLLVTVKREASTGARSPKWMVTDHLGTPRMIADETGSLVGISRHDYLPYGEELTTQSGRSTSQGYGVPDGVRQKFGGGHERDDETGLDYMKARYYSSVQGRFTSVDPENAGADDSDPQSWNGYAYGRNNPQLYTDPNGEEFVICAPDGSDCQKGISDDDFYKARKNPGEYRFGGNGDFFEGGNIYDQNGQVVAVFQQVSIDSRAGQYIYAIREQTKDHDKKVLAFLEFSAMSGRGTIAKGVVQSAVRLLGTARMNLLNATKNPKLRNFIKYLYRENATVGNGSTADAIRYERNTGNLLSPSGHGRKGLEAIKGLEKLIRGGTLDSKDREIAEQVVNDLKAATKGLK